LKPTRQKYDTYKDPEFDGDNSNFSAYEVFKNVRKGSEKTGNCLGLSQVASYLLQSKGINTGLINPSKHVLISANINNKFIPIETTIKNGFDYEFEEKFKKRQIENLEAFVLNNQGISWYEKEKFDLAIEDFTRAIELDRGYRNTYNNRGNAWYKKEEFDLAIKDYTRAIELDRGCKEAYHNRMLVYRKKGEDYLATKDYIKYKFLNLFS
jgi:tetratricopeptide (TPR) repeat protein